MIPGKLQRYFLLIILALVIISRLPTLFFPILDSHEANYAVQTAVWMDGGIPYVDFVENKTLLIHTWYRTIFSMFGTYNMTALHIADTLLILLTIAGIFFFTRYILGERTARWAALLYAVAQSMYDLNDFMANNSEMLVNAFAVFGAYIFFKSMREDRPAISLVAGVIIGISMLAKISGISLLAACILSMVWFWKEQKKHHWNRYIEEGVLLLIGVLFPAMLFISHVVDVGGMSGILRWTLVENLQYSKLGISFEDIVTRGLMQSGKFLLATAWLWILAIWAIVWFARRHRWRTEVIFLTAWIIFTIPAMTRGGRFFMNYYLQFLPPLTILAALGIVNRWQFYLRSRSVSPRNRKSLQAAFIILVFAVPYLFCLWLHIYEVGKLKERMVPVQNIARASEQYTDVKDHVFVWGNNADIYFFSRRKPASRFVYCSYLSGIKEGYEDHPVMMKRRPDFNAWLMLKKDFERRPPRVIVDMSPTGRGGYDKAPIQDQLYLANYLSDGFRKVESVNGADIYVRRK